jgi:signal peptidase II
MPCPLRVVVYYKIFYIQKSCQECFIFILSRILLLGNRSEDSWPKQLYLHFFLPKEYRLRKEIKYRWWIITAITIIGFALDWWTKYLAARYLSVGGEAHRLVGSYLELTLIYNKAAIFGLDPRHFIPGFPVNIVFTCFTVIAIIVLIAYYRSLKKTELLLHWGLAAILPGAIGNLFDRIVHPVQGVVDFIKMDLRFWPFNPWPVFNLADVYVTFGVGFMVAAFLIEDRRRKRDEEPANASAKPSNDDDSLIGSATTEK